jgi:hypothetical protein
VTRDRADPERAGIDARVRAWMQEADFRDDEVRFDAIARELFAFQYERCEPYGRFCRARGWTPDSVRSWREIPAAPTGAFKEVELRSFPAGATVRTFRTSGTSTMRRGELHLDTLSLYEASLLATFRRYVLPEAGEEAARVAIRVLAPAPAEAPDSSLSHMFGCVVESFGAAGSGFDVVGGALRLEPLLAALEDAGAREAPLLLCGTAFAFVHLLDELARRGRRPCLPAGSRLMETGGFKGRSRALTREALHAALEEQLGLAPRCILNQYGMTELGSQFYDSTLSEPGAPCRKLGPPWARVRLVDPEHGGPSRPGAVGIIEVVDLANTGSVLAVQTADLGRAVGDGFEVQGRAPGAEARGCSLAADEMLAGGAA